jgi:predicted RNA-binding Zn-ribbon protein involved in translation (DUF1610 family)
MQRLRASASCPSCGAPFELLEGANVARCPFCDLPLLLQSQKNILRYYLEPKFQKRSIPFMIDRFRKEKELSLPRRIDEMMLFYLPFWRFTAQAFYIIIKHPQFFLLITNLPEEPKSEEILSKEWDVNFTAHTSNSLGIPTLGMRPDWLGLKILTDKSSLKERGEILDIEIDSSTAKEKALKSLNFYLGRKKAPEDDLVLRLLEERLSLIYFPLWVANFVASEGKFHHIIDGITKRTLKEGSGYFELKKSQTEDVERFNSLKILPHRCPNCGWDLPVTSFHVVFPCVNCRRIWEIHEGDYNQIKGELAKAKGENVNASSRPSGYYPFWVFETRFHKGKSTSIQEVFELLPSEFGLFSVKDKSRPFLFYIPAFELSDLNKATDVGLAYLRTQPDLEIESMTKQDLKGVFIPEDDAKKLAELLWLNLISSKANLVLDDWKNPEFENGKIVWCPCRKEGTFLRDAVIGYSFQKVR